MSEIKKVVLELWQLIPEPLSGHKPCQPGQFSRLEVTILLARTSETILVIDLRNVNN